MQLRSFEDISRTLHVSFPCERFIVFALWYARNCNEMKDKFYFIVTKIMSDTFLVSNVQICPARILGEREYFFTSLS